MRYGSELKSKLLFISQNKELLQKLDHRPHRIGNPEAETWKRWDNR